MELFIYGRRADARETPFVNLLIIVKNSGQFFALHVPVPYGLPSSIILSLIAVGICVSYSTRT
jgi:hypothetical protein